MNAFYFKIKYIYIKFIQEYQQTNMSNNDTIFKQYFF